MGKDDLFKKRKASSLKQRRIETKNERESLWIICEGKSERNYLENLYPKKFRFHFSACLGAIKSKIAEESEAKTIFVLLDGDIHKDRDIENFRDYCKAYANTTVIVNSPCFEYWLLLHFEETTKPFIGNNQGKTKGSECVRYFKDILKKSGYTYKKGFLDKKLLQTLQESQQQALIRAKKTNKDTGSYTEMYRLFEGLKTP
ncbi:RloB family protein [Helicobacter brantae]|nr:RloB family protein [Helicobacter brantae]